MKCCLDNTDVAQHGLLAVVMAMMLVAFFATGRSFAAEHYYASVQSDRWHRDSTWGYYDGNVDTLIMWPAHPPEGGQPARIRTLVTIDQPVGRVDVTIVEYWAGGLRIIGNGSLTNFNVFRYYSRNDIETIGPDAYFCNAFPGTVYMYGGGGYPPIITGKLINQSKIIPDPASGTNGHIYNLFESANSSIYDLDFGTALYVNMPGGGTLAGSVQVEAGAFVTFTNGGIIELEAAFTGSGQVNFGTISVSGNRVVSIGNPVSIGVKLGSGTIIVWGALTGLGNLAEGTVTIGAGAWGGGIASVGGTLINDGTITAGYGNWGGSGWVLNNGHFVFDYNFQQDFHPNFQNCGVYTQVNRGLYFHGMFVHCGGGIEILGSGSINNYVNGGNCSCSRLVENSQGTSGVWIKIHPGASLYSPQTINFVGDTLDNGGTLDATFSFERSSPPQILTGGGTITNMAINGGNVQLLGPQTANFNLTLTSGTIQLYDNDLNLGGGNLTGASPSSYIVTNGTGKLIRTVGTSFVGFPVGTSVSYNPVTVRAGTGSDNFSVGVAEGLVPSVTDPSFAVQRTWSLAEGTPGDNGTITFTVQWNSGEQGSSFDRTLADGWRSTGGPWALQFGSLTDITPGTTYPAFATIATNSLSAWTVANNDAPLPIQLATFAGQEIAGHGVRLYWSTLTEVNNYGYYIQRKRASDSVFVELPNSFVPGHGTTNEPHNYSFRDSTVGVGAWVYRLKQVDLNGTVHLTHTIQIEVTTPLTIVKENPQEPAPLEFVLHQNYPNPFNPSTTIRFTVENTSHATLEIYDILGQRVATLFDDVAEMGVYHDVRFDASQLGSGVYFYRLHAGSRIDMKKLILLK